MRRCLGAPLVIATGGGFCAAAGVVFSWQLPRLREAAIPILIARGMIDDPRAARDAATEIRPG